MKGGPTGAGEPEVVLERGVRWTRDRYRDIYWWFEDEQRWVKWRNGSDAPPMPVEWRPKATSTKRRRLALRLVPLGVALLIIIIGTLQATRSGSSDPAAVARRAVLGKCFTRIGPSGRLQLRQVDCTSASASLKAVAVVPSSDPHRCPEATTATLQIGTKGSDIVCLTTARPDSAG